MPTADDFRNLIDTLWNGSSAMITDLASYENVGTIRYREDSLKSYCEMSMKIGPAEYAWVVIKENILLNNE